ncbi:tyrosine-protein kinase domain-containing protein [Nocardioides coralli]|uniref:tyrosine-protein kinase domain-containing protein n=1 Tax=Nocardioides coralli TaxID=2872154 RepID=UPI001CA3FD5E|nr:tyrosine-protein kinase domain-containing protein [Nocardioides coralli]QZY29800.1 polysaccharide biosynthesis tyrosine autokinase [Nocardioides coralli]
MEQDVTTLGDHLAIMRRRWRLPVVFLVLGVAAGVGLSALQDPLYRAESTLLLEPDKVSTTAVVMDADEVATQARVVASAPVAQRVVERLDLDELPDELLGTVTADVIEQTRTVAITAERGTAAEAAAVANAFAEEFVAYRTDAATSAADDERNRLFAQLGRLRADLSLVQAELDNSRLGPVRRQRLEAQEQSLLTVEAEIRTQLAILQSDQPTGNVGGQLLRSAEEPATPAQPQPIRSGAFGGVLGLLLGILLAYVRDRFDDAIRDEQRLRTAVGVPVLGRIPQTQGDGSRLVTIVAPTSPESEGYRSLTTNIRFLTARGGELTQGEMLVVSSADAGEGKTTVATNVAVTAARVGLAVILVDADLRNPRVAERFGIEVPLGLSHVLADQADIEDTLYDAAAIDAPGLRIMSAGAIPPNPAELLAGPRAAALWKELRDMADLVIIDTAPVLKVADTLEIVSEADLAVLVTRHRTSRVHKVTAVVERVRQVGGPVSGVAFCGVPQKDAPYGYGVARE